MPQYYDVTLKSILKDIPKRLMKILTGFETGKFIDVQFPELKYRQPDLLIELPDNSLSHMEIQAQNEKDMDCRMLDYCNLIYCKERKTVRQLLLYVGNEKMNMSNKISMPNLNYEYRILDIRDINCKDLLESNDPGDIVLAILCKTEDAETTVREILRKLYALPENDRKSYILKLLTLSRLRGLVKTVRREVEKMPVTIDVTTDELYLEGKEEGKTEGLVEGIEGMLEIKYGAKGLELVGAIRRIETVERLEEFKELIKKSDGVEVLKGFLGMN